MFLGVKMCDWPGCKRKSERRKRFCSRHANWEKARNYHG